MHYLKRELYNLIKKDEQIFDFIQEGSLDGLWYWDLEKPENEWMNERFWKVLGYNPDDMPYLASAWQEIINQDDLKLVLDNFQKHLENPNIPYDQNVRYKHKNGSTVWIRCRGIVIRNESGKPVRMLGSHQNITDLKIVESKLKESEMKFRNYIDQAPDGIFIADENGKYLEANPAACGITGYSAEELIEMSIPDLLQNVEVEKGVQHFQKVQRNGAAKSVLGFVTKRGENRFWDVAAVKLSETRFLGFVKDITEQKKAEDLLRISERRINTLMNNLPGMAYRCLNNPKWTMLFVSSGCRALTGYEPDDLLENTILYEDVIHPEDRKSVWENIQRSLNDESVFEIEYRIFDKSGRIKWVWERGISVERDKKGSKIIEGFISDITSRKQIEEDLKISDSRYRRAQQIGHVGNWEYNIQTTHFWGSDEARQIYGFENDSLELTTNDVENCIPDKA